MTDVSLLEERALKVIGFSMASGATAIAPLFSGGHDSLCAVTVASKRPEFNGDVFHIDTGIGAKQTREFVHDVAAQFGWNLRVYKSKDTYEKFVRGRGFPGPAFHQWAYIMLKERCIVQIMKEFKQRGIKRVALVTGARSEESQRRMGYVHPLRIGDKGKKGAINRGRYWVNPCHDWKGVEQHAYMEHYDLPKNPLKLTPIGMSGECFCGSFARPNEIALIRQYAPDVAEEIDRLALIAMELGKHSRWGTRPDKKKGIELAPTGPLCNSCDIRQRTAGIELVQVL